MNWEKIGELCQRELEKLEAELPPMSGVFSGGKDVGAMLLNYEKVTNDTMERAIRQFAATEKWPPLNPMEKVMLSFRLGFAASTAYLLKEQPWPWTDAERENQKEHRIGWLMLFAWDNDGFPKLQKTIQRLTLL